MKDREELLQRALERQKKARIQAEKILEEKSKELFDVTENLKRTNARLLNLLDGQTEDMDAAFINIVDPYVVMDLNFNVIRTNESAKEFLGLDYTRQDINLSDLVHPNYKQYTYESMQSLLEMGVIKNYRARLILNGGEEKYVQVNASLIYNSKGQPIAAQGIIRDITQEKEIESLLAKQRKQLDVIVDNSPLGIVLMDGGLIVKSNAAIQNMLGYNHEELKKIKMEDVSLTEEVSLSRTLMEELNTGQRDHYAIHKTYVRKDGTKIMAKTSMSMVKNLEGERAYQVGIVEDITKELEARTQLKESENRLATLIKNMEMAVLLEDESRHIALTNSKFCEMFGLSVGPDKLVGADCKDAAENTKMYFKDPEQFVARILEILKNKTVVLSDELEMVDGRVLERDYIPVISDGHYKGHLWTYRDVTLSRLFKRNLQAEKDKYGSIIANMNLGLIELDTQGKIQLVNGSFCAMSGFEREELLGKTTVKILGVQAESGAAWDWSQVVADKDSGPKEVQVVHKSGEIRYWLVSGAPRYSETHKVIGSIGIHLDITEHKQLQLEKEKLLSKLEESNQSLKEYAYVVSHDLKSPLRSIQALASWLKNDYADTLDDAGKDYLDHMQDKIESMEHLISGILEYSTANTSELKNVSVDLQEVVEGIVDSIFIPEHVLVAIPKKLPEVVADRTKMRQLFQNIISNAVVHIEKEEGRVEVLCQEGKEHWEFCIRDNGVGIPKKYHEKIFEIFQSASTEKKSTGIGLSIVKKIVTRYNGRVWVESEEGQGTDFYFTLEKQKVKAERNENSTSQKVGR